MIVDRTDVDSDAANQKGISKEFCIDRVMPSLLSRDDTNAIPDGTTHTNGL